MRGSKTGPKKEMETKHWSDCRARLNFIIYSIVRENGRERDGWGVKWEWRRERSWEAFKKKKKKKSKTFIIWFPNLLSPFHPSTISSTAGSQSLGEAGPTVLQWGNLHSLMSRLSLVTLNLILAAGTQSGPTRKGSAASSNRKRFMCVVIRPGSQRWQMRTFQRGLCQDTKLLSTSAF